MRGRGEEKVEGRKEGWGEGEGTEVRRYEG